MSKRKPRFNVDPEIDEELDAAIAEAVAASDRGEGIPLEVLLKEWENEELSQSK
jgi:hypothetical protein